jgi:hypothetical protein
MGTARRIYTFEWDIGIADVDSRRRIATSAVTAVVSAIAHQRGIQYEELTERSNPHPMIAVVFAEGLLAELFGERLEEAARRNGVRILHHIAG